MEVLETKPGASTKAVSAHNCEAPSSASYFAFDRENKLVETVRSQFVWVFLGITIPYLITSLTSSFDLWSLLSLLNSLKVFMG